MFNISRQQAPLVWMANTTESERVLLAGQYHGVPHGLGSGGLPHSLAVTEESQRDLQGDTSCVLVMQRIVLRLCTGHSEHCMGTQGWVGSWHDVWVSEQPWGNPALTMDFLASLQMHLSQVL